MPVTPAVAKPALSPAPAAATPKKKAQALANLQLSDQTQLTLVLIIALGCGLVASVAAFQFLRGKERAIAAAAPDTAQMVSVVVARQDLSPGAVLGPASFEVVQWPDDSPPRNGFSSPDELAGRNVKTTIYRGEPIVENRLVPKGERGGLYVRIPQGMLAMSVKVDPEIGVSGFIQPGNRVDVVATMKMESGPSMSKVVLQNILVLAVEHEIENNDDKPRDATTVTIAVTPSEAEKLALARSEGQVMLGLRNMRDEDTYVTPGFSAQELAKTKDLHELPPAHGMPPAGASVSTRSARIEEPAPEPEPDAVSEEPAALWPPRQYRVIQLIEAESTSEVKFQVQQ